jgi:histidyl-tRNA synthetase
VGIEAIGINDPRIDVEVISVADRAFKALGLQQYTLEITSLGDFDSREKYLTQLRAFIESIDLDEEARSRAALNPLRLFDDKRPEIAALMSKAPILMDYLSESSRADFERVKALLELLGISYLVNPRMVRGLDYYTGTAFEFVHSLLGAQSGIGGGGRYDGLMEKLGGAAHSGIGFGLGVDRILLACEAERLELAESGNLDLFIVPLGTGDRALSLAEELRARGIRVDMTFGERALKGGMKSADKSGAKYSIVLGADELLTGVVALKEMKSGEVTSVTLSALGNELIERISNFGEIV